MTEEKEKQDIHKPKSSNSLDSGKITVDELGQYKVPDKRKMYREAFRLAKNNAIDAGLVESKLISLDDIKGFSGKKTSNKKVTKTKNSKKKRK